MRENRKRMRSLFQGILALMFFASFLTVEAQKPAATKDDPAITGWKDYVGMDACSSCHSAIYTSYLKTAMARASGPATENLVAAEFDHAPSGVHYRVYSQDGAAWLSFERTSDPAVRGTRKLLYFIGSGGRGRTYLFSDDGFVFESPINWYAQKRVWDTAPAYQSARQIPMNLPAVPACLSCHTSNMQVPLPGTENKYASPLFQHSGITCERCHGPGAAHVSSKGSIVNPSKLPPARRDAVCMQCHLEGNIAIERPARHLYEFQPGEDLGEFVRYFVLVDGSPQNLRAVSQFEALAQSVCKQKSGDAMSCTSCHDPHSSPGPQEKISFYRSKCLACHGESFAANHHPDKQNCMQCHMPAVSSSDVAHTQATDHRILKVPLMPLQQIAAAPVSEPLLESFPSSSAKEDARDLALAWTSQAEAGVKAAGTKAEEFLAKALEEKTADPAILAAAGYFAQRRQQTQKAREFYQRALELDPANNDAASNLGVIEARDGHLDRAVSLWQAAFERAPARSAIGMNLVRALCSTGQFEKARTVAGRVLEFNPDLPQAIRLMQRLSADPPACEGK